MNSSEKSRRLSPNSISTRCPFLTVSRREALSLPVWLVRLFWLILFLPGGLPGVVPYLILWILIPSE